MFFSVRSMHELLGVSPEFINNFMSSFCQPPFLYGLLIFLVPHGSSFPSSTQKTGFTNLTLPLISCACILVQGHMAEREREKLQTDRHTPVTEVCPIGLWRPQLFWSDKKHPLPKTFRCLDITTPCMMDGRKESERGIKKKKKTRDSTPLLYLLGNLFPHA